MTDPLLSQVKQDLVLKWQQGLVTTGAPVSNPKATDIASGDHAKTGRLYPTHTGLDRLIEVLVAQLGQLEGLIGKLGVDFEQFSGGDFVGALAETLSAESLTRVLYPDDSTSQGQGLRFIQEYFLVACSLADLVR